MACLVGDHHFEAAARAANSAGTAALSSGGISSTSADVRPCAPVASENAETLAAAGLDVQDTLLLHVPFEDLRQAADPLRNGGRADLAALADEAHAEGLVALQAVTRHVHVARLEDAQGQQPPGKEHRIQREDRNVRAGSNAGESSPSAPALHQLVLDPEMIEYAGHDEVDQVFDALGLVVEARVGGKNHRSRAREPQHVFQMQGGERRLARHQDQLAAFLERDIRRALDEVVREARGDRGQRAHGAGADHHGVGRVGARGDGRKPVLAAEYAQLAALAPSSAR